MINTLQSPYALGMPCQHYTPVMCMQLVSKGMLEPSPALPLGHLSQHAFPNLLALPAISVAKLYPQCQATRCSDLRGRHLLNNCTNVLGCCTPSLVGSSPKNQFNTFPLTYRLASHTCVVNMARNMTLTLLSSCWTP